MLHVGFVCGRFIARECRVGYIGAMHPSKSASGPLFTLNGSEIGKKWCSLIDEVQKVHLFGGPAQSANLTVSRSKMLHILDNLLHKFQFYKVKSYTNLSLMINEQKIAIQNFQMNSHPVQHPSFNNPGYRLGMCVCGGGGEGWGREGIPHKLFVCFK